MVTFNESVDCMEGVDYTDAAFLLAHKIEVHDLKEESSKNNDKT